MATAKININIPEGLIEVEGDVAFVTKVYEDFKGQMSGLGPKVTGSKPAAAKPAANKSGAKKSPAKKLASTKGNSDWKPVLDKGLNLKKLPDFMNTYNPATNYERLLVYTKFLTEEGKKPSCSVHEIYSCSFSEKKKFPIAVRQYFADLRHRTGFLEITSPNEISVTMIGENRLLDMAAKTPEKA